MNLANLPSGVDGSTLDAASAEEPDAALAPDEAPAPPPGGEGKAGDRYDANDVASFAAFILFIPPK